MNEEIEKDIIMQIEMESYDKFNKTIATMNEHLGEMYGYSDVEDVKVAQLKFERDRAFEILSKEHKALLDIKEILSQMKHCQYLFGGSEKTNIDKLLDIINKALEVEDEN